MSSYLDVDRPFERRKRDHPITSVSRANPDDFFTDSLNESHIPSPSPEKAARSIARPRRAIGHTRSLRHAFEIASKRLPASNEDRATAWARVNNSSVSASASGRQTSREEVQTRPDFGSPINSDKSSPPRGLAESYQRIDEEEVLSGEEIELEAGQEPDDGIDGLVASQQPFEQYQEDAEAVAIDDGSDLSGISFAEDITDESLREKLLQHSLSDSVRLKRAVKRESPAFSRARVGSRSRLSSENLLRRSASGDRHDGDSSPSPSSTGRPKSWGSRGRRQGDWLRGIQQDGQPSPANVPLPDVLDSSSRIETPATLRRHDSSLDRIRELEEDFDLTGRSMHISSSPPIRTDTYRTDVLDEIRVRELESPEKRSPSRNRSRPSTSGSFRRSWGREPPELVEDVSVLPTRNERRSSRGFPTRPDVGHDDLLLRNRSESPSDKENIPPEIVLPSIESRPASSQQSYMNGEGHAISDSPITVYPPGTAPEKIGRASPIERPRFNIADSRETLRRLARAESQSPAPGDKPRTEKPRISPEPASKETKVLFEKTTSDAALAVAEHIVETTICNEGAAPEPETPMIPSNPLPAKTPVVTGAWIDTPMPAMKRSTSAQAIPDELTSGIDEIAAKTEEIKAEAKQEAPLVAPSRVNGPKSALEAVLRSVKSRDFDNDNTTFNIGEETIASLEGNLTIGEVDMDTLQKLSEELDVMKQLETQAKDGPTAKESTPLTEELFFGRLSKRLQSLQSTIHDTRKGITSLEKHVNTSPISKPCPKCGCTASSSEPNKSSLQQQITDLKRAQIRHNQSCTCTPSVFRLPRLYTYTTSPFSISLTTTGKILLFLIAYLWLEVLFTEWYAQPRYATAEMCRRIGPACIRRNAAPTGFALPTMLARWTGLNTVFLEIWEFIMALMREMGLIQDGRRRRGLWNTSRRTHANSASRQHFTTESIPAQAHGTGHYTHPQRKSWSIMDTLDDMVRAQVGRIVNHIGSRATGSATGNMASSSTGVVQSPAAVGMGAAGGFGAEDEFGMGGDEIVG